MKKPPVTLCYLSYVIEYAVVDNTVEYMNRRNLNVGGKWLGAVPKLAICKDIKTKEYFLAHCNKDWDVLCMIETHKTLKESKDNAEKHYRGINKKWIKTNYKKSDAVSVFEKEKKEFTCSFCGKNHYEHEFDQIYCGKSANICNLCVKKFSVMLNENGP